MVDKIELLKNKINEAFHPKPYRIDIIFEDDLEVYTVFVCHRFDDGHYFCYLTQWDNDFECIHEIELTPEVLGLLNKNDDLIKKIK